LFSLVPCSRDDIAAIAAGISAPRFTVMERPEARVYDTLKMAGLLSLLLVVAVEVLALFAPSLRRFAVFGLGRLLIYLIGMVGILLCTPMP
jgi:hypothetical protein